ncbi:uncharacterized protein VTP21DRAFT_11016 [Calcarisporiella thermophila]|uniref:uncharacterized protein n=1 Tax=Calcarisporiella thermophila TaxID=911321 RepID=UPI0037442A70
MSLRRKHINFEQTFAEFRKDLEMMYQFSTRAQISGIDMLQMVYEMCNAYPNPNTARLFNAIADFLLEVTTNARETILSHGDLVSAYTKEWNRFSLASDYANRPCDYLNRLLLRKRESNGGHMDQILASDLKYRKQTVQSLACTIWKENVILEIKRKHYNRLMYQVFEQIHRDRNGEYIDYTTVQEAIQSLADIGFQTEQSLELYVEEFETPYILHTTQYYEREAALAISTMNISEFMAKALHRLQQEYVRNDRYCHPSSHEKVIRECEKQWISTYAERIQNEFEAMISEEKFEDCSMAYSLLSRIENGLDPLLRIYENHITKLGKQMISQMGTEVAKNPREYVESLLDLHAKFMEVCVSTFKGDAAFIAAVDKAFRTAVNDTVTNPSALAPEVLARYCDSLLKKSMKSPGAANHPAVLDSDPEEKLAKMITLFKYVDDKDVFQKFYSRMLAKRLILGLSYSDEMEANMISKLKTTCGVEYTSKLQRMFTDMTVSSDLVTNFRDYLERSGVALAVEFNIVVLTAGSWPLSSIPSEFQLPQELEQSMSEFAKFYGSLHNGRRLTWLWHLSKAEIKTNYLDKRYELSVPLYQMGVLLLFNQADSLTVQNIKEVTRLGEVELTRALMSLIELRLLNASEKKLNDATEISVNLQFSSKRTKIKVTTPLQVETPQETDATHKAVDEDRRLYLQAAIVRVMKSRRSLTHAQLVQEVIDQAKARFVPSVGMIKKCIEQLLEKQYLERSREGRDKYIYAA